MREMKFRAWDKKTEDMIEGVLPLSDGTFLVENAESFKWVDIYCNDDLPPSAWAIMQYTGLKDKNSKEIYEGDSDGQRAVVFRNGRFIPAYDNGDAESCLDMGDRWYEDFEVIGNTYENPELIK